MSTNRNAMANARLVLACTPALLLFGCMFAIPLALVFGLSLTEASAPGFSLANFATSLGDPYFQEIFLRTFKLSALVTLASAIVGTAEAYVLHRMQSRLRTVFVLAILGPLLVAVTVRTLGWSILLGNNGAIAQGLSAMGLLRHPLNIMFTETAMFIGLLHMLLPYMVLTVWTSLQRYDERMERAAVSLGATHWEMVRKIVLPQVTPGILSGSVLVFSLAMSAFATPALLGGRAMKVVATAVYDEFLMTFDWHLGAALALCLLVINLLITTGFNRAIERRFKGVFA